MKIKIKVAALPVKMLVFRVLPGLIGLFLFIGPAVRAVEYNLNSTYDKEIWELNQEISQKQQSIQELQKQTETYKKILSQKQQQIVSLKGQVENLNSSIASVALEVQTLELQIDEVNLRLQSTQLKITAQEEEISNQKEDMSAVIRSLDRAQRQNNILLALASNSKLSDFLGSLQHLSSLEDQLYDDLNSMNTLKLALLSDQSYLQDSQTDLQKLQDQLQGKMGSLESQKYVKNALISQTRGEESKYQQLLEQAKKEVQQTNKDIVSLEQVAREKLNRSLNQGSDLLGDDTGLGWPVPSRYITSYFHDPSYPFRNVFEHPAIDIKAAQGTEVHAAQSGYVARAKDAGLGYSYVMLVHDNGLSTVYGHVSKILVEEDTFVTKGQVIALSGGTPGTRGAGNLTTGAHLHFEVRLNGIPVNPLNYLTQ